MPEDKDIATAPKGEFDLVVKNRKGEIIEHYVDHNVIVNGAKVVLAYLISDETKAASNVIKYLAVSESTETSASAAPTDTSLPYPLSDSEHCYYNTIDSVSYPENENNEKTGTVRFHWSLDFDEAQEMSITNFGLYTADQTLFAHKTRQPIYKDPDLSFTGTWSIIF